MNRQARAALSYARGYRLKDRWEPMSDEDKTSERDLIVRAQKGEQEAQAERLRGEWRL